MTAPHSAARRCLGARLPHPWGHGSRTPGGTAHAPPGARLTHPHMLGRHARASEPGVLQFSLLFFFSVESSRNGLNLIAGPVCVRQWDESQRTRSLASSPPLAAAGLPPGQCSWPQGNWVALGHSCRAANCFVRSGSRCAMLWKTRSLASRWSVRNKH